MKAPVNPSQAEQLELALPEVYRHRLLMDRKLEAARKLIAERGLKTVADALDQIWGPLERPVSSSTLGNCLRVHDRSYWRSEWDSWFCQESTEFRDVVAEMCGQATAKRTPEQINEAYAELVAEKLSPKEAQALIRKAKGL